MTQKNDQQKTEDTGVDEIKDGDDDLMQAIVARQREIKRTLEVFHEPGDVIEIRALNLRSGYGRPFTAAGYFDDFDVAALKAAELHENWEPEGMYFVLNRLNPTLLARIANMFISYPSATTGDIDIIRRRWLLIDVDPMRPKGISSTDVELEAARVMAGEVKRYLCEEVSWPEPVEALSGNGMHLLFPIDMPNDDLSREEVKNILLNLKAKFTPDDSAVSIDTSVFNAARITKLYGTMARKGSDVPDRPHRHSKLIYVPNYLEPHLNEGDDKMDDRSAA